MRGPRGPQSLRDLIGKIADNIELISQLIGLVAVRRYLLLSASIVASLYLNGCAV